MMTMEKRMISEKVSLKGNEISGYAAVFNSRSVEFPGGWVEVIEPRAFDGILGNDIIATFNHNFDNILGRTSAGTLKLGLDEIGLFYRINLPSTTLAQHLKEAVNRRDVTGSSFMFEVEKDRWEEGDDGLDVRYLEKIKVVRELGPVTLPAYEYTTAEVNSRDKYLEEKKKVKEKALQEKEEEQRKIMEEWRERQLIIKEKMFKK